MSVYNESPIQAQSKRRLNAQIEDQFVQRIQDLLDEGYIPSTVESDHTGEKAWLLMVRLDNDGCISAENSIHLNWKWLARILPLFLKQGYRIDPMEIGKNNPVNVL